MKCHFLKIAVFLTLVIVVSSCIKEEYNFDKLDLKVNVGGEMLSLPLGRTDSIKIMTLLNTQDLEILQKYDGAYALRLQDAIPYDISSKLPDLKDKLKIEGKEFPNEFPFQIGIVDLNTFRIPAINEEKNVKPGFPDIDISNIDMPVISNEANTPIDIGQYKPSDSSLTIEDVNINLDKERLFNFSDVIIQGWKNMGIDPATAPDVDVPFGEPVTGNIQIDIELPEGVTNIDNIDIGPDAVIEITTELLNPVLSEGTVTPDISFNPSDLFTLKDQTLPITLDKDLNAENNFKATYQFDIEDLNIEDSAWEANVLHLTKEARMEGSISLIGGKVPLSKVDDVNNMGISVKAVIKNIKIVSIDFDFPAISDVLEKSIEISLPPYDLVEPVKGIDTIYLESASYFSMSLNKVNMESLSGVNIAGELEIHLPEEIIAEGAVDNIIHKNISILGTDTCEDIIIKVLGFDLSKCTPVDGKISLNTAVEYDFNYSVDGRASSKYIPENPSINMNLTSSLIFDHAIISVGDISQDIEGVNFDFTMEMPDEIAGYGKIVVEPKGEPQAVLSLNMPELPLDYEIAEDGMLIALPTMLIFKDVNPEYNFNEQANTITLRGEIPDNITLNIDKVAAEAKYNDKDGKYYLESTMAIVGGIQVNGGKVNTDDLQNFGDKSIDVNITIPELVPENINLESLKFDINEEMFLPIEMEGIDQLYSLDSILVSGAQLSLNVSLIEMPDLGGSPINVDFYVALPDAFLFNDSRIDENNVMHIESAFSPDGTFSIDPIIVRGVSFDGEPLHGLISLSDTIKIDGSIKVDNPRVDISDLSGRNVKIRLLAAISDFSPVELYGKIDYPMDPVVESLALNDIPDFLRSDDCVLDVENPHIAMTLVSNVGIPINGILTITPYIGEGVNNEGIKVIRLNIPKCDPDEPEHITKYWIGNNPPTESGYEYIQTDLSALIKRVPDRLEIRLEANTDLNQQHYLNVNTDYKIKFNYDLVVPLMFGEDLQISICDTIGNIPALITETLRSANICLGGTIENSLPLQLELSLKALDANKVLVPITSTKQTISACGPDGKSSISNLDLRLSADGNESINDIVYLELTFRVTSPNVSGVPITDQSFVRADLNALIEGGITLDLNKKDK